MWSVKIAMAAMVVLQKLVAKWVGYWRYRVGDYRVICRFENKELVIEVIGVGHRSDVY